MKRFLLAAALGTAGLLVLLYVQTRKRLQQEAKRFDEVCPELPPEDGLAS